MSVELITLGAYETNVLSSISLNIVERQAPNNIAILAFVLIMS